MLDIISMRTVPGGPLQLCAAIRCAGRAPTRLRRLLPRLRPGPRHAAIRRRLARTGIAKNRLQQLRWAPPPAGGAAAGEGAF